VRGATAGLHFDDALLEAIRQRGVKIARVTLHVGPVPSCRCGARSTSTSWHPEPWIIDANAAELVNDAKRAGKRVVAVGTTSVRCLESAARDGRVQAGRGLTRLFIKPGHAFRSWTPW